MVDKIISTDLSNVLAYEDFQAWELYPQHRGLFNKLDIALQQGLQAGPAGVAPLYSGRYVSRPIYNIYGMGLGAKQFYYDNDLMREALLNNDVVPPGHFWCEWLPGKHLSADFHRNPDTDVFYNRSVWAGTHYSEDNLTKFSHWTRENAAAHPYSIDLALPWNDLSLTAINLEMRGDKVIEVHLRLGNDPWDDLPVGTEIVPIWDNSEVPKGFEYRPDEDPNMERYLAGGHLSNIRKGHIVRPSSSQQTRD